MGKKKEKEKKIKKEKYYPEYLGNIFWRVEILRLSSSPLRQWKTSPNEMEGRLLT
jgi:hypothetical protein